MWWVLTCNAAFAHTVCWYDWKNVHLSTFFNHSSQKIQASSDKTDKKVKNVID